MDGEDGAMIQNVAKAAARPTLERAIEEGRSIPDEPKPLSVPKKPPPGTVERSLTIRDRNFIVGACRTYCENPKNRKFKDHQRLERVKKILAFEETLEYNAVIEDELGDERLRWQGARNRYKFWLAVRSGSDKISELKKEYPNLDIDPEGEEPSKPPARPPEHKPEVVRGPERTFHIPAKIDAWIEEALARMDWPTIMTEGAVELCVKYGIDQDGSAPGDEAEEEAAQE